MEPLRQRFQNFGPARTLATKISEFWTCWNPCVKDFRILAYAFFHRGRTATFTLGYIYFGVELAQEDTGYHTRPPITDKRKQKAVEQQ